MDYEQMEIDITLESDRDLKENMQHWSRARAIPSPCGTWESAHSEYRERP